MNWYTIKVVGGKEKKVREDIEAELKRGSRENVISKLLILSEKGVQIRNGKKIAVEKNSFPGYIFVECESISVVESNIKHISGVSSILKSPLSKSEVDRIVEKQVEKEKGDYFYLGQKVKIIDGPFSTFVGTINKLDSSKQKVKVSVLVFGRETMLDLTFSQIIKEEK